MSAVCLLWLGCSGGSKTTAPAAANPAPAAGAATSGYGPLEVGADYQSYKKVSKEPFFSKTHGKRFVEVYVNETGYSAYTGSGDFPVGTVIVKTSWERDGDKPTDVAGPIFVMEKRSPGFDAEHEDWWYGFHWAEPPSPWREKLGGPTYWRSPDKKVSYCWNCHEDYDREVGLPPREMRTWLE